MRIGGYGGNGSGDGSGRDRNRADTFRGRHRLGERLSGRLIAYERPGLARIDFQGLELTARIESTPLPLPGQFVLFRVLRLVPEIVLQELGVSDGGNDPLFAALHAFWAARATLESRTHALRADIAAQNTTLSERHDAWLDGVSRTTDIGDAWAAIAHALAALNALLTSRGPWRADYQPWLLPEALSSEILLDSALMRGEGGEAGFSFSLPDEGQCEIRIYAAPPRATCRLSMEHPAPSPRLHQAALDLVPAGLAASVLPPQPLPQDAHAGVLARLAQGGPGHRLRLRV
ncbi:hypothetical protein GGQ74_000695 [Desulfobaculum xiamenense]|uniref:Uncharacterized protein n=1 Tax=Desulfobaculum xiamenense TaxID=995050 RepID=A0A846QNS4_9BACT|nr:hypothetical protein [Desulfobaculum xiamenense]NJB67055.1 hypothetical protein [Desulfobaculum xiamenense]